MFRCGLINIFLCLTIGICLSGWTNEYTSQSLALIQQNPTDGKPLKQITNPSLKYPDLSSFQNAISQSACLLKGEHVYLFAPQTSAKEAGIIFPYLTKAYETLREITGVDTEFIIVIYNFPKGHPDAWGGTSNCAIWYDDSNLHLDRQEEWNNYGVPHVSGYIEEMAHNFVSATKAQFGWEEVGWSLGARVSARVAGNPYLAQSLAQTRREQENTFRRYIALGFTFPPEIPPNLVDRIHAYLLRQCEKRYGADFWKDFFKQISRRKENLVNAVRLKNDDAVRNERYRITIECLDCLPGLHLKKTLQQYGISLTTDVKSLHPMNPTWNRKLY